MRIVGKSWELMHDERPKLSLVKVEGEDTA